jgi:hypothetical protein
MAPEFTLDAAVEAPLTPSTDLGWSSMTLNFQENLSIQPLGASSCFGASGQIRVDGTSGTTLV